MILHVACLPFPSYQGTQAALHAMLRASTESGHEAHLLVYSHGAYEIDAPYPVHRVPDFPKVRSLRSGPSVGKLVLDARAIGQVRSLVRSLRPEAIIAHHVEAALVGLAARVRPLYYVAHTCLERELPVYLPTLPQSLVSLAGRQTEALVCRGAQGVAAVSPSLAATFGVASHYLPVPWPRAAGLVRPSQTEAREALGLRRDAHLCLYAGNLDRYQGWEDLLQALPRLRATHDRAALLVATESDPTPVLVAARQMGIDGWVHFRRLDGERARALAHAAGDLAWIPRRIDGGLPIKMLDALARGLPVVAMDRATAGLSVAEACVVVADDDPAALAFAAGRLLDDTRARDRLRERGFHYLATEHGTSSFDAAMKALLGQTTGGPTPCGQPRSAGVAPRARRDRAAHTIDTRRARPKERPRPLGNRQRRR
ncbi:MAG: glycosyltransferase family 4 protein [Myxococcales bacterium]